MKRRTIAVALGLLTLVVVAQGCRRSEPPPIGMQAGTGQPLAFPPRDEGWSDRVPLPKEASRGTLRTDEVIRLAEPRLDAQGYFEFQGQTLRLSFTEALFGNPANAPTPTFSPAVAGKMTWEGESYGEFRASKPFDPDVVYTVTLPARKGPSGKTFPALTATFKATPLIPIAGKTINYIPASGHPRIVAIFPNEVSKLGGAHDITLIFDQPVDVALAKTLAKVEDGAGKPREATFRHPSGTTFEGVTVDPRMLVIARPQGALAPGDKIAITARSKDDATEVRTAAFTIAEPTKVNKINDEGATCGNRQAVVKASPTRTLTVAFTNPLQVPWDAVAAKVHVTPKPRNLYVTAWDSVQISGSFSPSTTYAVQVDAMPDAYGGRSCPVSFTLKTNALGASAAMSDGVYLLDDAEVRAFSFTTRNVLKGSLELWPLPKGDAAAFTKAVRDARLSHVPQGTPAKKVPFVPQPGLDRFVETSLDLAPHVERGRAYVARLAVDEPVADADTSGSSHGRPVTGPPAVAVLFPAGPNAMGAHVHRTGERAIVQAFRLASGQPVAGATVAIGGATATTDALGTAAIDVPRTTVTGDTAVAISSGDDTLMVPMDQSGLLSSPSLFPELGPDGATGTDERVGMLVTDRGIYKPGSVLHVKAFARRLEQGRVKALARTKLRLRLVDPLDTNVFDKVITASDKGTFAQDLALDASWHTGRYHLRLEADDDAHTELADETVRIVAFEAPKFKVDVEATKGAYALGPSKVRARVTGTYLFGAPMNGAQVAWTIQKSPLAVNGGAFADAGMVFAREANWWDEDSEATTLRPVTGEGTLGGDGTFVIDADPGELAQGPTELTVEADVTDASHRHVAGTYRTTRDPFVHHAGIKLARRFGDAREPIHAGLGVVDPAGRAVVGVPIVARAESLRWTRTATRAESGAVVERWSNVATTVGTCSVVSAKDPVPCELPTANGGSYRVTVAVDGRDDASVSYWAYGNWSGGAQDRAPSAGKKVPLILDKNKYAAGDTAHVLVQSPYAKAIALLTVEQGGLLSHETVRIEGPTASFDVPVEAANSPWVNAVVTLLPVGESEADYRVGAARIPVASDAAKLDVHVTSGKKKYEVGDEAAITIAVKTNAGAPVPNADVTLAVADEGVLRMTSFHAPDAASRLHPGRALSFTVADSRAALLSRRERAHVAGGGGGGEDTVNVRKNFVETAAWLPNLTTDVHGNVTVKVKLPDNLTEFRMMAVAVDADGRGGSSESTFLVSKSLMLEPVMPRFALRGDTFEAAAIVHNNTDAAVKAKVTVAGQDRELTLPAHGHERVGVPMSTDKAGTRTVQFSLRTGDVVRDKVELPLRVDEPGITEAPSLFGAFAARQEVRVKIPSDAMFDEGAALSIKTGAALYPELGKRLSYLLDYPHGCVEQTTSSLLPLLAARTILPWTGANVMDDAELRKRIQTGIDRLATMRTPSGGLAYWPGGTEPNLFGTAYAMRALVRARSAGIEAPGLIAQVSEFLQGQWDIDDRPSMRVSIAEALALAGTLPESYADTMYDARTRLDTFGLSSLAIALAALPNQEVRVREVLDMVEGSFDQAGQPKHQHGASDWYYWSSTDRDRAQALIALIRTRGESRLAPVLADKLTHKLERWNTQTTAWSLMALADYIGDRAPKGAVDVGVKLEGRVIDTYRKLGGANKEVRVPLKDLVGKEVTIVLEGDAKSASAFSMSATYKRSFQAGGTRLARRGPIGMSLYRAYSDASGKALDLDDVKPGQIVRVAVRAELPGLESYRLGYVAITDRLPAGLAPIDTDLATTSAVPGLAPEHPYYDGLTGGVSQASHVDLRDDRVQIYFDEIWNGTVVYATYLTRATTPGHFTIPPARGELMYEFGSEGYSDVATMTVR